MASPQAETRHFIRRVLADAGAKEIEFAHVNRRDVVSFEVAGDRQQYSFSSNSGDFRARQNISADLRRLCRNVNRIEEAMDSMNGAAPVVEPLMVSGEQALSLYRVSDDDDEPRVRDIDLAVRLGMKNPRKIRDLIRQHREKLNEFNCVLERTHSHPSNNTTFIEFYLDRKQATFLAIRSNTPVSDDVAMELVEVYEAWRRGTLPVHPNAPGSANLATDAAVAVLTQIRDGVQNMGAAIENLRSDQAATLEVVAGLESRLEARIEAVERKVVAPPAPAPAPDVAHPQPTAGPSDLMKIAHWCEANGIEFGTAANLGQQVGARLSRVAQTEGLPVERQPFSGRRIYPREFLDRHADQIRAWLA